MAEIIGVRFKEVGKIYYFDPNGGSYREGEAVIVETARGTECGTVAIPNREVEQSRVVKPLKKSVIDKRTAGIFLIVLVGGVVLNISPVWFVVAAAVAGVILKNWEARSK